MNMVHLHVRRFGWQCDNANINGAVLDPLRRLERDGFRVTILPVDRFGQVSAGQVETAITDRTLLVSVMGSHTGNEEYRSPEFLRCRTNRQRS